MYKPNLVSTVGKKELETSENERKKKPEAKQKDEFDNTVMVSLTKSKLCLQSWFEVHVHFYEVK